MMTPSTPLRDDDDDDDATSKMFLTQNNLSLSDQWCRNGGNTVFIAIA
jgi:hypothetical protein